LIAAGENVNAAEYCIQPCAGYPVLRYAIGSGSEEIVRLLLQYDADPNRHTLSPIMHPERPSANVRNLPLLSYAIQSGASLQIVELLIECGADINQKTMWNEWTPIMVAAYCGNWGAVRVLLKAGANYAEQNKCDGNRTAYDYACEIKNKEIMNDLFTCIITASNNVY
jgi:ankyrin repeat protein